MKFIKFTVIYGVVFIKICHKGLYRAAAKLSEDAFAFGFKVFFLGDGGGIDICFSVFGFFAFKEAFFRKAGKKPEHCCRRPVFLRELFIHFRAGNMAIFHICLILLSIGFSDIFYICRKYFHQKSAAVFRRRLSAIIQRPPFRPTQQG